MGIHINPHRSVSCFMLVHEIVYEGFDDDIKLSSPPQSQQRSINRGNRSLTPILPANSMR